MPDSNIPVVDLSAALNPASLAPWIEYQLSDHAAHVTALMARNAKFLEVTEAGIADDFIAGHASDFAKDLKAEQKATDDTRTKIKAPVLNAQRLIDGEAKKLTDTLAAAVRTVEYRLTTYLQAKEVEQRRLAEIEAQRLAVEAEAAIQAAESTGTPEDVTAAVEAIGQAQTAAEVATASPLDLTRTRSQAGSLTALRQTWTYELVDITKVPASCLMVNDAVVKAMIKSGSRDIPGLRVFPESKAYVR